MKAPGPSNNNKGKTYVSWDIGYAFMDEVADAAVETPDRPMPFSDFIHSDHSTAMGVVILHKGKIVSESYPRMQEYEKPIYWSTGENIRRQSRCDGYRR